MPCYTERPDVCQTVAEPSVELSIIVVSYTNRTDGRMMAFG